MQIVPIDDLYQRAIQVILGEAPDFATSIEYSELVGIAENLPGVVATAYARYLNRRAQEGADPYELMSPLNALAMVGDGRVDTMLCEEPLEQMQADGILEKMQPAFNARLSELAKKL